MSKTITYKGKQYPIRMFIVDSVEFGDVQTILISVQTLSDTLGENKEVHGTVEEEIDSTIYFFVEDDKFNLSPEEICNNHLDIPMKFMAELRV
jgi:hypothetical protein